MSYIGKSPTGTGVRSRYYYTATGGETSISGADDSGATLTFTDGAYVDVYLNGVLLVAGTDYNTSTANTIGSLAALAGSDIVEVLVYDTFTVADAVKASSGGTFNGAITVNGTVTADDLTVDTNTLYVDSTNNRVGIGTSSPSDRLHILNGSSGVSSFASNTDVIIEDNGNVALQFASPNTSNNQILFSDPESNVSGVIQYNHSTDAMSFETNGSEAMRIDSSGNVLVGTTDNAPAANNVEGVSIRNGSRSEFSQDGGVVIYVNRLQDGALMSFRSEGTGEGTISVSGTTVTYGGGHLARWSRLPNDVVTDIPKGTVMTNLDDMITWTKQDGTVEDNEQLNYTEISSIEGDVNVAGVFDHWDNDDDGQGYDSDFFLAETGDFIIRIAQGTTVQRGDLLMSAGDGTAKPQGDDIVRSKTIAKVTSTHVSHTYDDGSYLVPCVLMAC